MSIEDRITRLEHPDGPADHTEARIRDDINMTRWHLAQAVTEEELPVPPPAYEGALEDPDSIRCWLLNGANATPRRQHNKPDVLLYAPGHPLHRDDGQAGGGV
jgi:hypothetical protein